MNRLPVIVVLLFLGYICLLLLETSASKAADFGIHLNLVFSHSNMVKRLAGRLGWEEFKREVRILQALSGHENVVQLCEGGELLDRILSKFGYDLRSNSCEISFCKMWTGISACAVC
ncbi:hypothetical protein QVD17_17575 [Tagetes erecta]|uniref:Uncharacterized protein n=1 Tax=Tagetes erecta TaxID=13708 RepID=A0AAD8KSG9_TARER|nr:hypothetical protein QVD17_17575 [Tagetes erecta]